MTSRKPLFVYGSMLDERRAHRRRLLRRTRGRAGSWEFAWRRERHKPEYIVMIRQYMALYGNVGLEEAEALWERLSGRSQPGRKLAG